MNALFSFLLALKSDTRGATAVEYGLIVSLIVIAIITAIKGVATENVRMWNDIKSTSANAIAGTTP